MSYSYKFEYTIDSLIIRTFDKRGKLPDYEIPKRELMQTSENSPGLSYWIEQLADKNHMSYQGLVLLAKEIKKHSPQSQIDWEKTLTFLEEDLYISEQLLLANPKPQSGEISAKEAADGTKADIKLKMDLRNREGFSERIKQIVNLKLKEFS